MASPISAANAYANIANLGSDPTGGIGGIGAATGKSESSFGSMLKEALDAVHETGRKSDAQSQAMVNGKPNSKMVDVVTSVAETEVAINAVVAVRDKVIAAYEEIMRMPI